MIDPVHRPRVLLDCDGILSAFVPAYLRLVNAVTGREHTPEQVTSFDIATSLGLTADESRSASNLVRHGFCAALDVCEGARDGVKRLRGVADVYIVTSPWQSCPTWTHDREAWLERHFGIPHSRVIHTSAKHLVRGDFLVDDKTSTLVEWQAEIEVTAIQWATPHNRLDGWTGLSTNDWGELVAAVAPHMAMSPVPPLDFESPTASRPSSSPGAVEAGPAGGEAGDLSSRRCTCHARMAGECMCGAWEQGCSREPGCGERP